MIKDPYNFINDEKALPVTDWNSDKKSRAPMIEEFVIKIINEKLAEIEAFINARIAEVNADQLNALSAAFVQFKYLRLSAS